MSLPRFLDRVVDAAAPVLGGIDRSAMRAKLESSSIALVAGDKAAEGAGRAGFLLAANLAARIYPRICLRGPNELIRAAESEIILINPRADMTGGNDTTTPTLSYETVADADAAVSVFARGWNVYVDTTPDDHTPAAASAALAAAAFGMGDLFRLVFAAELGDRGRRRPQPGSLNLVTLGDPQHLPVPAGVEVSTFRLIGVGAIGQATAQTLALSGVRGTMVAVDPEKVVLSNLQRYVLTRDADVDAAKVELVRERLDQSTLQILPVAAIWHADLVEEQLPTLVAVDSAEARIAVQASLPGPIYNAWTQPADIGWSRHEHFGEEPCLACLYWPDRKRPSRHEQIAAAFRQHPLRVLVYLLRRLPVGLPVPPGGIPVVPGLDAPADADRWLQTALVDDIAAAAGVDPSELVSWRERSLADVYQDGICGGTLLHLNIGEAPREVVVPLAHQSALAGVMLATEFIVAEVPELAAARPSTIEARYDPLAGLPQVLARPRMRADGCLCADTFFRAAHRERTAGGDGDAEPEMLKGEVT
ncbi:MAG TPA: ThiF family adenylyltransferase [bacterium]|nr:ThiF family adenylyltransferase [bacterium]